MADQLQLRGGTATENDNFTGAAREITVDTTNNSIRVQDGVTSGGHELINKSTSDSRYLLKSNNLSDLNSASAARENLGIHLLSGQNAIINGNFDIWQRGTSFAGMTSDQYTADRWLYDNSGGTATISRQSFTLGQTDVPNEPEFFAHWVVTSAEDYGSFRQKIEGVRMLAGQTCTISFWAKYTTAEPTGLRVQLIQDFGSGGTPSSYVATTASSNIDFTTSWQKFTYTVSLPSVSGKTIGTNDDDCLILSFQNTANEIFDLDIAQVQVEEGSVATNFERRNYSHEMGLCLPFYEKIGMDSAYQIFGVGVANSSTSLLVLFNCSRKRAVPALSDSGNFEVIDNTTRSVTNLSYAHATRDSVRITATTTSLSVDQAGLLRAANDSTAYIEIDSEL